MSDDSSDTGTENFIALSFIMPQAKCTQTLQILDPNYSKSDIIEGLKDASLATTTWHSSKENPASIDRMEDDAIIAKVIEQEFELEDSYFNFNFN